MTETDKVMTPRPADKWEKRRHEDRRIRNTRYGFFRTGIPVQEHLCSMCNIHVPQNPNNLIVNGEYFHGDCWVRKCRADRKNNS